MCAVDARTRQPGDPRAGHHLTRPSFHLYDRRRVVATLLNSFASVVNLRVKERSWLPRIPDPDLLLPYFFL